MDQIQVPAWRVNPPSPDAAQAAPQAPAAPGDLWLTEKLAEPLRQWAGVHASETGQLASLLGVADAIDAEAQRRIEAKDTEIARCREVHRADAAALSQLNVRNEELLRQIEELNAKPAGFTVFEGDGERFRFLRFFSGPVYSVRELDKDEVLGYARGSLDDAAAGAAKALGLPASRLILRELTERAAEKEPKVDIPSAVFPEEAISREREARLQRMCKLSVVRGTARCSQSGEPIGESGLCDPCSERREMLWQAKLAVVTGLAALDGYSPRTIVIAADELAELLVARHLGEAGS